MQDLINSTNTRDDRGKSLMKIEVTYCLSNCRPCRHVTLLFAAFNWASPSINSSGIKKWICFFDMLILTDSAV